VLFLFLQNKLYFRHLLPEDRGAAIMDRRSFLKGASLAAFTSIANAAQTALQERRT
jgi:hypothetical protein